MPPAKPIKSPAGYVPAFAVGYSGASGELTIVDSVQPLPVAFAGNQPLPFTYAAAEPLPVIIDSEDPISVTAYSAPAPAPLQGTSAISAVAGPFTPVSGRAVVLTLSGTWAGSVQLTRSSDGGGTRHPVTVAGIAWGRYAANACEPVWEEQESGASLYLDITLASGALTYRLAQ
jgi:hypothetical protein